MGKGVLCNIQSVNKQMNGTTQGSLLCVIPRSNRLCSAGTESRENTSEYFKYLSQYSPINPIRKWKHIY